MHPIVHFQEETVTWGCNATPWEKRNTDQNFQAWSLTQQHIDKLDILWEKKSNQENLKSFKNPSQLLAISPKLLKHIVSENPHAKIILLKV